MFADTSFWVALTLQKDRNHADARALWDARDVPVLVTSHVLGEVWTFLRRRDSHTVARRARRLIARSPSVEIEHVIQEIEDEAWRWLDRHDERAYSFVDATSFAIMRRRGMLEALAFEGDFSAAGFVELRP